MLPDERDLFDCSIIMALYSSVYGSISSLDLRVKVDFRSVALVISLVNTRFENMPMRIERANDHCITWMETVRLVFDLERLKRPRFFDFLLLT